MLVNVIVMIIIAFFFMVIHHFILLGIKNRKAIEASKEYQYQEYRSMISREKIDKIESIIKNSDDDMTVLHGKMLLNYARQRHVKQNLRAKLKLRVWANLSESSSLQESSELELLNAYESIKLLVSVREHSNADNMNEINQIGTNITISARSIDFINKEFYH